MSPPPTVRRSGPLYFFTLRPSPRSLWPPCLARVTMPSSGLARDEADSRVMFEQPRRIRRSDREDNRRTMARKNKTANKKRNETSHGVIPAAPRRSLARHCYSLKGIKTVAQGKSPAGGRHPGSRAPTRRTTVREPQASACAEPNRPARLQNRRTARAPDKSGFHSARGSPGFAKSSPAILAGPVPGPSFLLSLPLPWNEQFSESTKLEKVIRANRPGLGLEDNSSQLEVTKCDLKIEHRPGP